MADQLQQDETWETVRFSCECIHAGHSLTVVLDQETTPPLCSFEVYLDGRASLSGRIKQAWNALRGRGVCTGDFILRPEDAPALVDLVGQLIDNDESS